MLLIFEMLVVIMFGVKSVGDVVNFEIDILVCYVEWLLVVE